MLVSCFLRKGIAYVPTYGLGIESPVYDMLEPIDVVPAQDSAGLRKALKDAIARGNPRVPLPLGRRWPKPPLLKYAKVRGETEFQRGGHMWDLVSREDKVILRGYRSQGNGVWSPDPDQTIVFPPGDQALETAMERLIAIVQAKARD